MNTRIVEEGARAWLRIKARRRLAKMEHISTDMADAIFWDDENDCPLDLTRQQQAMLIVFGKMEQ